MFFIAKSKSIDFTKNFIRRAFEMKAIKIKMKRNCEYSTNVQDIDSIYIDEMGTYVKKAEVYDYLKKYQNL